MFLLCKLNMHVDDNNIANDKTKSNDKGTCSYSRQLTVGKMWVSELLVHSNWFTVIGTIQYIAAKHIHYLLKKSCIKILVIGVGPGIKFLAPRILKSAFHEL